MLYELQHINVIKDYLLMNHFTLAVAESVTSGHLQAAFSSAENAGLFFQGGITAYNCGQKVKHLNIEPIHAESRNCVSDRVAHEMAANVCDLFRSNIGIGITGYAAPVPELNVEGLFAYFTIIKNKDIIASEMITSMEKDPVKVQIDYANQVIKKFSELVLV
jgi:nicotinamide-nucleotide amidase